MGFADQTLAEDGETFLSASVSGSVPGVTRAEGGSDHRYPTPLFAAEPTFVPVMFAAIPRP
jgi:hypothetical protein